MADFLLTVGIDTSVSLGQIQSDINNMISKVNANPPKVKVDLETDSASMNKFKQQIANISKNANVQNIMPRSTGSANAGSGIAADLSRITSNAQTATKAFQQMKTTMSSVNADKIRSALSGIDGISSTNADKLVSSLEQVEGTITSIKAKWANTNKGEPLLSVDVKAKNELGQTIDQLIQYNAKTGEISKQITSVTQKFQEAETASKAAAQGMKEAQAAAAKTSESAKSMSESPKALTSGTKEYSNALTQIDTKVKTIRGQLEKWTAAKGGKSSEYYTQLNKSVTDLETLRKSVESGTLNQEDFTKRFAAIKASAAEAAKEIQKVDEATASSSKLITSDTTAYQKAETQINNLLGRITENRQKWTAAKDGKSSASYTQLGQSVLDLKALKGELAGGTLSESDFAARFNEIKVSADQASAAIKAVCENMKATTSAALTSGTKDYNNALAKINDLSTSIARNRENWTAAQNGQSSASYAQLEQYATELENLRNRLESGTLTGAEFNEGFGRISSEARLAFSEIQRLGEAMPAASNNLAKGTAQYMNALREINTLLAKVRSNQEKWTAAKNGRSAASYEQLTQSIGWLETLRDDVANGNVTNEAFRKRFAEIKADVTTATTAIKGAGEATSTWGERIRSLSGQFSTWFSITQAIMQGINAIKQMTTNVIELDSAMTELRKVTDASEATYDKFLTSASDRAKKYGASLIDTVSATSDFARLGYGIDDAAKLADASIVYKNVGDDIKSIGDASSSVISTMQAFGIEAEDVMTIVDRFNEIGNKYAISSGGVGDALMRSAAAMQAAGNTLDETIGLVTAANTVVQDPDKVGTTLKTVSMYLRAAKTDAEEAGESTDGMAESVSKLRDEFLTLTNGKVDIQLDEDTYKSTYQILKELSQVWDELTNITQANILEKIGGKRNSNIVAALLENFQIAEDAMNTAADSEGSALAENDKVLDSIQGKINVLKASWQDLSQAFISSDFIGNAVTGLTGLANTFEKLASTMGPLPTTIGVLTTALRLFGKNFGIFSQANGQLQIFGKSLEQAKSNFQSFGNVITSIKNASSLKEAIALIGNAGRRDVDKILANFAPADQAANITALSNFQREVRREVTPNTSDTGLMTMTNTPWSTYIQDLPEEMQRVAAEIQAGNTSVEEYAASLGAMAIKSKAAAIATTVLSTAMNVAFNMLISWGISLAIQGMVTGLDNLIHAEEKAAEKAKEIAQQSREAADSQAEKVSNLSSLIEKYQQLASSETQDASTRSEIADIQSQIVSLIGAQAGNLDLVNGKLDEQLAKLREIQGTEVEQGVTDARKAYLDSTKSVDNSYSMRIDDANKEYKEIRMIDLDERVMPTTQKGREYYKQLELINEAWSSNGYGDMYLKPTLELFDKARVGLRYNGNLSISEQIKALDEAIQILEDNSYTDSNLWNKLVEDRKEFAGKDSEYAHQLSTATGLLNSLTQQEIGQGEDVHTFNEYINYRDKLIDTIANDRTIRSAIEDGVLNNDQITSTIDNYLGSLEKYETYYKQWSASIKTNNDENITQLKRSYGTLRAVQKAEMESAQLAMEEGVKNFNLDNFLNKTKFGNIDLNNRQALEWDIGNRIDYQDAIKSWNMGMPNVGDISTVLGMSETFGNKDNPVEIAFSPMLQTDQGAVLLSSQAVHAYMEILFAELERTKGNWTTEDLLELDSRGTVVAGQEIKNIIADVGETAQQTGIAMHYLGTDGAISQDAIDSAKEFGEWIDQLSDNDKTIAYSMSFETDSATWTLEQWHDELQRLKGDTSALDELKTKVKAIQDVAAGTINFDISAQTTGFDTVNEAISSSVSSTGLTSDMISKITDRYSNLEVFDASALFEKTVNGIHLNADSLRELEAEYNKLNGVYLQTALDEQVEKYNELTKSIAECSDETKRASLMSEQHTLKQQIEDTADLAAQYDGLTSAYKKWVDAQSAPEEGDMYDNLQSKLEDIKELYKAGLVGTNEFRSAVQLMTNFDISDWDIEDIVKAYDNGYPLMTRYFTEGQKGCNNFLKDVSKLNDEWAHLNADGSWEINFGEGDDQAIADKLGVSVDAVQMIMRKLSNYGFKIDLTSIFDDLDLAEDKLTSANEKLKELGETEVTFNFNSSSVTELDEQIEEAQNVLGHFKNADGSINISTEGAQEAIDVLTGLIRRKQELEAPAVMKVDVTSPETDAENAISLLQQFQTAINQQNLNAAIGLDTTDAQSKIDSLVTKIQELQNKNPDIAAALSIDATSADTIKASIEALTPEVMVKAGVDEAKISEFKSTEIEASGTVTWDNNTSLVDAYAKIPKTAQGVVEWKNNTDEVETGFSASSPASNSTPTPSPSPSRGGLGGAYSGGTRGAKKSGMSLGGELGEELVVRDGRYFTIGSNGAEFFNYKKDDIIFNAEQTRQIFKQGKITSGNRRGRALVTGNAFSSGTGKFFNTETAMTYSSKDSKKKSSETKEESEFEKQYKKHQHLLNMEQESAETYLNWLKGAYKDAYNSGQIELDEFYKYEEEVYSKSKELFNDTLGDMEHEIEMLEHQNASPDAIVSKYVEMMDAVSKQEKQYRAQGLDDNSDAIQELQDKWWNYYDKIKEKRIEQYEDAVSASENIVKQNETLLDNAVSGGDITKAKEYSDTIIAEYRRAQETIHAEAEYYRSLGYEETSDEISDLSSKWQEYQDNITETAKKGYKEIVSKATDITDSQVTETERLLDRNLKSITERTMSGSKNAFSTAFLLPSLDGSEYKPERQHKNASAGGSQDAQVIESINLTDATNYSELAENIKSSLAQEISRAVSEFTRDDWAQMIYSNPLRAFVLDEESWSKLSEQISSYMTEMNLSEEEFGTSENFLQNVIDNMIVDTINNDGSSWENLSEQIRGYISSIWNLSSEDWNALCSAQPLIAASLKMSGNDSWQAREQQLVGNNGIIPEMMNSADAVVTNSSLGAPTYSKTEYSNLGISMGNSIIASLQTTVSGANISAKVSYGGDTGITDTQSPTGGTTSASSIVAAAQNEVNSNGGHLGDDNKYSRTMGGGIEEWCGDFVDYCAKAAGINAPRQRSVINGASSMSSMGLYRRADEYDPKPGDFIYFSNSKKGGNASIGSLTHIGIVESFDKANGVVHTIEGNTNHDSLMRRNRPLSENYIAGYGITSSLPRYEKGTSGTAGGSALVGEKGRELAILPSGQVVILGKHGAEIVDLPARTQILPNDDTEEVLSYTGSNIDGHTIQKYARGTTVDPMDIAKYIREQYPEVTDQGIAAILGNIYAESGFNTQSKTTEAYGSGSGRQVNRWGLFQLDDERIPGWSGIVAGGDWRKQIDTVLAEGRYKNSGMGSNSKYNVWDTILTNSSLSASDAAALWDKLYERSDGSARQKRMTKAEEYYQQIASGSLGSLSELAIAVDANTSATESATVAVKAKEKTITDEIAEIVKNPSTYSRDVINDYMTYVSNRDSMINTQAQAEKYGDIDAAETIEGSRKLQDMSETLTMQLDLYNNAAAEYTKQYEALQNLYWEKAAGGAGNEVLSEIISAMSDVSAKIDDVSDKWQDAIESMGDSFTALLDNMMAQYREANSRAQRSLTNLSHMAEMTSDPYSLHNIYASMGMEYDRQSKNYKAIMDAVSQTASYIRGESESSSALGNAALKGYAAEQGQKVRSYYQSLIDSGKLGDYESLFYSDGTVDTSALEETIKYFTDEEKAEATSFINWLSQYKILWENDISNRFTDITSNFSSEFLNTLFDGDGEITQAAYDMVDGFTELDVPARQAGAALGQQVREGWAEQLQDFGNYEYWFTDNVFDANKFTESTSDWSQEKKDAAWQFAQELAEAKSMYSSQTLDEYQRDWNLFLTFLSSSKKVYYENQESYNESLERMYENSRQMMEAASDALSQIDSVYSTLHNAANEYADSGFISVDTYQSILDLGVEYLAMLKDENGQLVINDTSIKKVLKTRIQQVGVETALNYIEQLRMARAEGNVDTLTNLLYVTDELSTSTWDLVYAELASVGLSEQEFNAAYQRINSIRILGDTAAQGVGKTSDSIIDGLNDTADALDSILQYTIDMIKQETQNKIDALEEQISDYKEIISLQKESLEVTREQDDYNKSVSDKLKEISETQSRINQLSLDDSREAQAEKKSLEEELSELQTDLSDYQADYAYEKTTESLDKMAEAYEEEKNDEIETLENSISSYQKLYDLAIARIKSEGSDLLDQLLSWNEEYGSDLNSTIVEAWKNASDALDEYNYKYEKALKSVNNQIEDSSNNENLVVGRSGSGLGSNTSSSSGSYDTQAANTIVAQMKANSNAWYGASETERENLASENQYLGKQLKNLGVKAVYDSGSGTWYIGSVGGTKLYDAYPKYHTGGVVGASTSKKDEVMAVLQDGELVIDKKREEGLYKIIDFAQVLSERLGKVIDTTGFKNIFRASSVVPDISSPAPTVQSGVGTIDFNPSIEINITHNGEMTDSDARRYGNTAAEAALSELKDAFTKRGITTLGGAALKSSR